MPSTVRCSAIVSILASIALSGAVNAVDAAPAASTPRSPSPMATPGTTVTPTSAETFTSADGLVRVDVPVGATPQGTHITVTPAIDDGLLRPFGTYSLEPDGLTFDQPVRVTRTIALYDPVEPPAAITVPLLFLVATSTDGSVESLTNPEVALDLTAGTLTIAGTTTHFSRLDLEAASRALLADEVRQAVVSSESGATQTLTIIDGIVLTSGGITLNVDPAGASIPSRSSQAILAELRAGEFKISFIGQPTVHSSDPATVSSLVSTVDGSARNLVQEWRCEQPGDAEVAVLLGVQTSSERRAEVRSSILRIDQAYTCGPVEQIDD